MLYELKIVDGAGQFTKYYEDGKLHVQGTNLRMGKRRSKPQSGNWIIYHSNGSRKRSFGFQNGRKYGEDITFDPLGRPAKTKYYSQKWHGGFYFGYFQPNFRIESSDQEVQANASNGLHAGFYVAYDISNTATVEVLPSYSLLEYELQFTNAAVFFDYVLLSLPASLRFKIWKNLSINGGVRPSFRINGRGDKDIQTNVLMTSRIMLGPEIGVGYKVELRNTSLILGGTYFHQLNNWLVDNQQTTYNRELQSMKSRSWALSIIIRSI